MKKYKGKTLKDEELEKLGKAMTEAHERIMNSIACDLSGVSIPMKNPNKSFTVEEAMNIMERTAPVEFVHKCSCNPGTNPQDNWAHRSAGMKCRTCMWFNLKDKKVQMIQEACQPSVPSEPIKYINNNRIGRCKRHAPTMNGFPVVFEDDWCGDHKLDENKI